MAIVAGLVVALLVIAAWRWRRRRRAKNNRALFENPM